MGNPLRDLVHTGHTFEAGDWVCTHPLHFQGAYVPVNGHMGRVRLDKPHEHFSEIISQHDELMLVRDLEVWEAEQAAERELQTIKSHENNARWHKQQADAARKRRREALVDKRRAAKLPIKQPKELA